MKVIKKTLILLILFLFFSSCVYANDTSSSAEVVAGVQNIINVMYMITWPLLAIAGKALGTDFVYGTAFGMDYSLFALWQMSRTVANYMIGITFIIAIFAFFWNVEKFNIKKIAPKLVLATVLVNASWFIMGALLDISIIITMGVGHLGDVFLKDVEVDKERVIVMGTVINLEKQAEIGQGEYKWCNFDGTDLIATTDPCLMHCPEGIKLVPGEKKECSELKSKEYNPPNGITIADLEKGSDGLTGPLFGLFRFVNAAAYVGNNVDDTSLLFITGIKLFVLAMLIMPLIGLAIVTIIRVLMLWVFIGFAPLIVGAYVLGYSQDKMQERIYNILSIIFMPVLLVFTIVIGLVFISALTELMPMGQEKDLLTNLDIKGDKTTIVFPDPATTNGTYELLKIQTEGKMTGKTNGLPTDLKNLRNVFGWMIVNLLCAFILRVLFMTAMKASAITKKIGGQISKIVGGAAKAAPILPGRQSISSMQHVSSYIKSLPGKYQSRQSMELNPKVEELMKEAGIGPKDKDAKEEKNKKKKGKD